jgi:hypothetical protein
LRTIGVPAESERIRTTVEIGCLDALSRTVPRNSCALAAGADTPAAIHNAAATVAPRHVGGSERRIS